MIAYLDSEQPKYFGIGLSRTGTTSLHAALLQLGFRSHHWVVDCEDRLADAVDAYAANAISDLNASYCFETLYYAFPAAKFIYTQRPEDQWVEAVKNHYGLESPQDLKELLRQIPVSDCPGVCEVHRPLFHLIHHAIYTGHPTWLAAYRAHDARVKSFFGARPDKLLEIDIFSGAPVWPALCDFVGRPLEGGDFPRLNWRGGSKLRRYVHYGGDTAAKSDRINSKNPPPPL
ncbi:sulfotransferase [Brevundimonas sp.]|uniref:sulfotransferase n=1 Tax=Brevundimonas sp. TaxID=1871086 RepID=UPI0025D24C40|nr:sulfotransferase [Brevundimonas sp.]